MDFSSAKRGSHPAPAQGRKTERNRNEPQSRNAPLPPRQRQRHTDTHSYSYEAQSTQHHNNSYDYIDDQYPESTSTQWERQPSAHLSEIESVDGSQQQQGEIDYEGYESENRLTQAPRSQGGRQSYAGVQQSFNESTVVEPRHPSQARIRQAQAVDRSKNDRDRQLPLIGKTGPQPFKAAKPQRTRGHQTHNDDEPVRHEPTRLDQGHYSPSTTDRRGITASGPKQPYKPVKSKMHQSTKFDTPSEKGTRLYHGDTRSSDTSQRIRIRQHSESDGLVDSPQTDYTPTGASKTSRPMGRKVAQDLSFDIDQEFDDSALLFDGPSDDVIVDDFGNQEMSNTIPPTPPSDRTLALVSDRDSATIKPKINLSSGIDLDSDGLGEDMFELLDDVVKGVVGPTTKLHLKMPKTVDQVVKHISTVLANKVAKHQGDIAIKSSDKWDWSRLSGMVFPLQSSVLSRAELTVVLSSEMNEGIKEMEDMIKGAGEKGQGGIEEVKRKRVDMESRVTGQYEAFRKDFREACEKMQQPAILGKKFKFGPF